MEEWSVTFLHRLRSSFEAAQKNPFRLFASLAFCLTGWVFLFVTVRLIFFSLSLFFPLPLMCLIVTMAEIASLLPLPAGTGGTDLALVFLYNHSGLPLEASIAASLLGRFFAFYLPIMVGGILSLLVSIPKDF